MGDEHRGRRVLLIEAVILVVVAGIAAVEAPGFASSVAADLARLRHPDLGALAGGAALEALSLVALAAVPRWLLARCSVRLSWHDAVALVLAGNGMSVILPAGAVTSSVWTAHQYHRRGARAAVAAWVVLAGGFASSVTVIALGLVGALLAEPGDRPLVAALFVAFVAGTAGVVWLAHRAERVGVPRPGDTATAAGRLSCWLVGLIGDSAGQRAGWRTGSAVLGASLVNWLADCGVLATTFHLLRLGVPWRALLLAYAAGQIAGSLVPLPGGVGVVEGGTVGVLVALGVASGPAVAVVAVYRLLGYWAPTLASVPAYGWVRRHLPPAPAGDGWAPGGAGHAGGAGIEPATFGSKVRRSAN